MSCPAIGARNSLRGIVEEDWARVSVTRGCSSVDVQYLICLGSQEGHSCPRGEGGPTGCPLRLLPSLSSLEPRVGTAHGAGLLLLSPKEMQCWKPDPVFWHTEPCTVMASPGSLRL